MPTEEAVHKQKMNKVPRLVFANKQVLKSFEQRSSLFFSNEFNFNIFGYDGKQCVRRRNG